jgi:hypothetical protein
MHAKNVELNSSLAHLKSEIKILDFTASLSCKSCDALLVENLEFANDVSSMLRKNEELNSLHGI